MSADCIASTNPGISSARPTPKFATIERARSCERLMTLISVAPSSLSRRAASAPILPAPITRTDFAATLPTCALAKSTAAVATDVDSFPIVVCERAALPALSASRKSVCSVLPSDRARCAWM